MCLYSLWGGKIYFYCFILFYFSYCWFFLCIFVCVLLINLVKRESERYDKNYQIPIVKCIIVTHNILNRDFFFNIFLDQLAALKKKKIVHILSLCGFIRLVRVHNGCIPRNSFVPNSCFDYIILFHYMMIFYSSFLFYFSFIRVCFILFQKIEISFFLFFFYFWFSLVQ